MDVVRITELQPKTYVEQGDYIAIDNQSDGTKKVQFTNLLDSNLSTQNKAADAQATGQAINELNININTEASVRQSTDNNLQAQIDQLVAPSGTAPNPAEIENARVGADGVTYDTLGNAIRTQVTNLKSGLSFVEEGTTKLTSSYFESGTYNSSFQPISNNARIRSVKIPVYRGEKITMRGGQVCDYITYGTFNSDGVWSDVTSWSNAERTIEIKDETFIAFICKSGSAGTTQISPSDFDAHIIFETNMFCNITKLEEDNAELFDRTEVDGIAYHVTPEVGTYTADGYLANFAYTVRTTYMQDIEENIKIELNENWRISLYWYSESAFSSEYYLGRNNYWSKADDVVYISDEAKKITGAKYFAICFFRWDGRDVYVTQAITTEELESFSDNYEMFRYTPIKKYIDDGFAVVGDEINAIHEKTEYNNDYVLTTEIGNISPATGSKASYAYTVVTTYAQLLDDDIRIKLNENWRIALYWYTNAGLSSSYYLGRTTFWTQNANVVNITAESKKVSGAKYYGIVFFRWDGASIDITQAITDEEIASFSDNYEITKIIGVNKSNTHILVAANDSSLFYKTIADYRCTGTNDELVIQEALDEACDTNKELWLAPGNYSIDNFYAPDHAGNGYHAIWLKLRTEQHETVIKGIGGNPIRKYGTENDIAEGAVLRVSQSCYSNLDASTQYAVFAGNGSEYNYRRYPWLDMRIENVGIIIPDNQKKIIGIDGYYATRMYIKNIMLMCQDAITNLKNGVAGCIGIRGMCGSAFGEGQLWEHCFAWGFHTGYSVAGEHLVCIELGARFCDYGYRFNDFVSGAGATWLHPITLINCCDECNFNMPYFGNSGDMRDNDGKSGRQTFNLIDFNFEWLSAYTQYGGSYATEEFPGCTFANITYTVQGAYGTNEKNRVNVPFWASGQGFNSRTVNMAHAQSGTTAERNTYAPTHMQQYYDTDLNKLLIYDGTNWRDAVGTII